jgi:hypothetical protein
MHKSVKLVRRVARGSGLKNKYTEHVLFNTPPFYLVSELNGNVHKTENSLIRVRHRPINNRFGVDFSSHGTKHSVLKPTLLLVMFKRDIP